MEVDHEEDITSEDTWYDTSLAPNGDIILSLPEPDNTEDRILYRADKLVLSRHSTVFAGLFSIPYNASTNEEYDGVPVVRLEDDGVAMRRLLYFLYHSSPIRWDSSRSECTISNLKLLSIARKYEIDSVRESIVDDLEKEWPTTLTGWIIERGKVVQLDALYDASSELLEAIYPDERFPEPAVAVRIGLDYHVPNILPAAFYCLAWIRPTDDWARYHQSKWNFGKQSGQDEIAENPIYNMRRTARWSLLDKDTLYRVLLGKAELRKRQEEFYLENEPSCTGSRGEPPMACGEVVTRLQREYDTRVGKRHCPGPLETLLKLINSVHAAEGLCWTCKRGIRSKVDSEVHTIWKDLPRIFALDSISGFEKYEWDS